MEQIARTVDNGGGLLGFLGGGDGRCTLGGVVLGMFSSLETQCRKAIARRQHMTNEGLSMCVIRAFEKHTCADANKRRSLTEIRDGVFISKDRTNGEISIALRRAPEATCSLAGAKVTGLPGCMHL